MKRWVLRMFFVYTVVLMAGFLTGCTDNKNFVIPPPKVDTTPPTEPVPVSAPPVDTACSCGPGPTTQDPAPPKVDPALPTPVFSIKSSLQLHGQVVTLKATDSIPAQAVFEFTWDNGKNWKQGDSLILCRSGTVGARLRLNSTTSEVVKETFTLYYKRVLIVGNSMMLHGPKAEIGWTGSWGMAASKPDSDYVHRLTRTLKEIYPEVQIKLYNAVPFEAEFATYDLKEAAEFARFQPDLIIMRIVENAYVTATTQALFRDRYEALIKTLLPANSNTKVVCTTSFWPDRYESINAIRVVAAKNNYDLVELGGFFDDKTYTAAGLFKDSGVAKHPGDKGMKAIYEAIMDKL